MKYRTQTLTRMVARTIGGVTHTVPETYTEQVPVPPRDWDQIAKRVAGGIVLTLTAVAVVWSTVSIGSLLGGDVGYAAATVFDASWLTVLILEWLSRFDPRKRAFPRAAGWLLALLAAGAIFWHGMLLHSPAMAVIGALVSVVAKLLWLAVFRHIDRPISAQDAAWLAAEESRLSAQEAIATIRLRAAAAEERAALRLMQAEQLRAQLPAVSSEQVSTQAQIVEEQVSEPVEHAPSKPLNPAQPQVFTQARPVEQLGVSEDDQREREVLKLAELLRTGEQLTGQRAGELLGVSRATGQRRLAEAKAIVAQYP